MNIVEISRTLNKEFKNVKFKCYKGKTSPYTQACMYNKEIDIECMVTLFLDNRNFMRIIFDFGKINFNNEILFCVNEFNRNCPNRYMAYVDVNDEWEDFYLIVHYIRTAKDLDGVVAIFKNALDYLMSKHLQKYLHPIYKYKVYKSANIKEMN